MHARIGLTDGRILVTDAISEEDMANVIAEEKGLMGEEGYSKVMVENVDDAIAFLVGIINAAIASSDGIINALIDGENQEYTSDEVAWFRVVR